MMIIVPKGHFPRSFPNILFMKVEVELMKNRNRTGEPVPIPTNDRGIFFEN
jgi:hypothetical protein